MNTTQHNLYKYISKTMLKALTILKDEITQIFAEGLTM